MIGVTSSPASYIKIEGPRAYITQWQVLSAGDTITIPTSEYSSLVVDWGDGVNETITTGLDIAHQYADAGIYTVQITWESGRIRFNNTGDKDRLLDVTQWGTCEWTNCEEAYEGCSQCLFSATDTPDFSQVVSMQSMFRNATNANPDTSNWDTSQVLTMRRMFREATNANPNTSNWNTSEVETMNEMFYLAVNANPDVSGWNTSQVENIAGMFLAATTADPDVSGWNISEVTTLLRMFSSATSANPNTTNWNTSKVENMQEMFQNATNANPDVSNWDTSQVENMSFMFRGATIANPITTNWDTSNVKNMLFMFADTTVADPDVSNWDTGKVTNMAAMFQDATSANPNTTNWNTGKATDLNSIFLRATNANPNTTNWDTSQVLSMFRMFRDAPNANPDLSTWDFSKVTSLGEFALNSNFSTANYEAFLANAAGQTLQPNVSFHAGDAQYNGGTPTLNKQEIETLRNWTFTDGGRIVKEYITEWQTISNLETITIPTSNYSTLDVDWGDGSTETISSGGSISHEYSTAGIYSVKIDWDSGRIRFNSTGDKDKILDVTQWGSCKWASCEAAYRGCTNCLFLATDTPDFSQVVSMQSMFEGATNANPNTTNWDTSNVVSMRQMFQNATSANPITANWDTGKVENMSFMFAGAIAADPDTTNWNTVEVTNMRNMFIIATNANPDTTNWNTANVENMQSMFQAATNANPNTANWDTGKVTTMRGMFEGATNANPDLSSWDLSQITDMTRFALNTNFSTANYEAFLANAAGQTLQSNVSFHAGSAQYNSGAPATNKASIESTYNWTFTDGGQI